MRQVIDDLAREYAELRGACAVAMRQGRVEDAQRLDTAADAVFSRLRKEQGLDDESSSAD